MPSSNLAPKDRERFQRFPEAVQRDLCRVWTHMVRTTARWLEAHGMHQVARRGGQLGGRARAVKLTKDALTASARKAATARWRKRKNGAGKLQPVLVAALLLEFMHPMLEAPCLHHKPLGTRAELVEPEAHLVGRSVAAGEPAGRGDRRQGDLGGLGHLA